MKPRQQAVIKGSSLPVLRIVVRDGDPHSLPADLAHTIDAGRTLLGDGVVVLDLRERLARDVDPAAVVDAVRDSGVRLAALLISETYERRAFAHLDLPVIEAPLAGRDRPQREANREAATAAMPEPAAGGPPAVSGPAAPEPRARASHPPLYVTRPLRSGQRVYAQGRDAVVAAPTSRGSELIADGSIYAFSPLRGRVLAGASGDTHACIVASHLDAELVAIAGVYRTLEAQDLAAHAGGPVTVTLAVAPDGSERLTLAAAAASPSHQRNQESRNA